MLRNPLSLLILAAALAVPAAALAQAPAQPGAATDGTLLSVSATGEARRVPDVATLSAGVVTRAADANAALRANAAQMNRLMEAVRKAGIAERDIQTSDLGVSPQYDHRADGQVREISGYEARNTVNLTVRDISDLGGVIDALVAAGANQVYGPNFQIGKPDEAHDEARRAALDAARARAGLYAEALGLRVRRIVSISEGGGFMPRPMMAMRAMDAMESSPVSPAESTLSVNLDVVFELGR